MSVFSAVSILNELATKMCLPISFILISANGESHCPTFRFRVEFGDLVQEANGNSKKEAKQNAAAATLAVLATKGIHNPNAANAYPKHAREKSEQPVVPALPGAVMKMNGIVSYELVTQSGPSHKPTFGVRARIGEVTINGEGKTKKEAKQNATSAAFGIFAKSGNCHSDKSKFAVTQQSNKTTPHNFPAIMSKPISEKESSLNERNRGSSKIELDVPTETEKSVYLLKKKIALGELNELYSDKGPCNHVSSVVISNRHNALAQSIDRTCRSHLKAYLCSESDSKDPVTKIEKLLKMMKLDHKWVLYPAIPINSGQSITFLHITKCDPPIVLSSQPTLDSKSNAAQEAIEYFKDML